MILTDLKTEFITWFHNEFSTTQIWADMDNVCEDSPWHRESTVAVHTRMVTSHYLTLVEHDTWTHVDLCGAFACAFHDVGKPEARAEAYKPERGVYYRYGGHELISARMWETWAADNWIMLSRRFGFTGQDVYRTGWMIENHLPWCIKKADKRNALAMTANNVLYGPDTFINVLKADTWGRISDDATEKRATVTAWCNEFEDLCDAIEIDDFEEGAPKLFMLIGASGSGKSSWFDLIGDAAGMEHFSLDRFRHEWYDRDDYKKAFELACADKGFMNKANAEYSNMLKSGNDVVVDNTNTSKKRRAHYIRQAKQAGYYTVGVVFPISLNEVIARQHTREDKNVPEDAVVRQYNTLSLPSYGEFDSVFVVDSNLVGR
jgi:predicted kinase